MSCVKILTITKILRMSVSMQMENFKKGITSIAIGTEEIPPYSKLIWLQREDYHWQMAKKKRGIRSLCQMLRKEIKRNL